MLFVKYISDVWRDHYDALLARYNGDADRATTGTDKKFWAVWKEEVALSISSALGETEGGPLPALINLPLTPAQQDRLYNWRKNVAQLRTYLPHRAPRLVTAQDRALYALLRLARLLELVYRFIVYDGGVKKIARYQYLGRRYRLKVLDSPKDIVKPTRGWLRVYARDHDPACIQRLVEAWYRARAQRIFAKRLEACYARARHLGIPYPTLAIRKMKARWGSCLGPDRILLNTRLVQAPLAYIDYVILHEMCHLAEPNHGARFEALLTRLLPDWRERREKLNMLELQW